MIEAAVIGVGQTKYEAKRRDVSMGGLVRKAIDKAMLAADVDWDAIDAVILGKAPDMFEGVMMPELSLVDAIGANGKPLLRAYSIASPSWDDELEFYSIKVQDGPLTSRLQHLKVNDQIILRPKPVGTLVHDALLPGSRLWLFATGTGIAPFASLIRDPQTFEDFDQIILTHTCRELAELEYGRLLVDSLSKDELMLELLGENNIKKLTYYPTTTRENSACMGRITDKLKNNNLFSDLNINDFSPDIDRAMVCGSIGLNLEIKAILDDLGFREGANSEPAEYVVEKAFVG